jgi:putative membrane protein
MMGWGWDSGWGFFGILHIVWWALIVVGIVVLIRWLAGGGTARGGSAGDRPLEVLKERYARGEIDQQEFEQKKRDLSS